MNRLIQIQTNMYEFFSTSPFEIPIPTKAFRGGETKFLMIMKQIRSKSSNRSSPVLVKCIEQFDVLCFDFKNSINQPDKKRLMIQDIMDSSIFPYVKSSEVTGGNVNESLWV